MVQIRGKYFNGVLTLQEPVSSESPLEVIVIFPDVEASGEKPIDLADFGFAKAQMLLKDFKGSFTETLLEERKQSR